MPLTREDFETYDKEHLTEEQIDIAIKIINMYEATGNTYTPGSTYTIGKSELSNFFVSDLSKYCVVTLVLTSDKTVYKIYISNESVHLTEESIKNYTGYKFTYLLVTYYQPDHLWYEPIDYSFIVNTLAN